MAKKVVVEKHTLIPKHTKLNEKDKKSLLEKYAVTVGDLPKIPKTDPALKSLNAKAGDVIKIVRNDPTSGESVYYRGVING